MIEVNQLVLCYLVNSFKALGRSIFNFWIKSFLVPVDEPNSLFRHTNHGCSQSILPNPYRPLAISILIGHVDIIEKPEDIMASKNVTQPVETAHPFLTQIA